MQPRRIDPALSVGAQIRPEDVATLAARGFRSVICNRPDGEDPGQPDFAEIAGAARAAGLAARHIPVAGGAPGAAQARDFAAALREMPAPVFAYCHSDGRAAALGALTGHPAR